MSADLTVPPPWLTDEQIDEAFEKATAAFRISQSGPRGQMVTSADALYSWFAGAVANARDAQWSERIASLQARLDAAERDAARYRLIEHRFASAKTSCSELVLRGLGLDGDPTEPLSTAIDAATQET